jgi:cell division septation protein DedD
MASPHVAGVAALVRRLDPTLTPEAVAMAIRDNALEGVITDVRGSPNLLLQVPPFTCDFPLEWPTSPTSASTSSPTFAPTSCIHTFGLELLFDDYPGETSWNLQNPSKQIVAKGSEYHLDGDIASFNTTIYCIDDGEYTFTIYDLPYGDGMCCSFGSGHYTVFLDDVPVKHGGDFGSSETTIFGEEAPVSPSTSPSSSPSDSPSTKPSSAPSTPPSTSPTTAPSTSPSSHPSTSPSTAPSTGPSNSPSASPSTSPSTLPSVSPSDSPSNIRSTGPSTSTSTSLS